MQYKNDYNTDKIYYFEHLREDNMSRFIISILYSYRDDLFSYLF